MRVWRDVVYPHHVGLDARIYIDASRVWLAGGDPWQAILGFGIPFWAPPPSLLVMAPFTLLPTAIGGLLVVALSALLAVAAIRSLRLPLWWLLWAPVLDGILVGASTSRRWHVWFWAALVSSPARTGLRRRAYGRRAAVTGSRHRARAGRHDDIAPAVVDLHRGPRPRQRFLRRRRPGRHDVDVPVPVLWVAMAAGLSLGVRRASWLAVPLLAPFAHAHYAAMALPFVAKRRLLAVGFAWS